MNPKGSSVPAYCHANARTGWTSRFIWKHPSYQVPISGVLFVFTEMHFCFVTCVLFIYHFDMVPMLDSQAATGQQLEFLAHLGWKAQLASYWLGCVGWVCRDLHNVGAVCSKLFQLLQKLKKETMPTSLWSTIFIVACCVHLPFVLIKLYEER